MNQTSFKALLFAGRSASILDAEVEEQFRPYCRRIVIVRDKVLGEVKERRTIFSTEDLRAA